ncbi:MAG: TerB family tellurite resistance protein [Alphaproteobacteria bacterium]
MIKRVLDFLTGQEEPAAEAGPGELELAVAALLVEAARMDQSFDAAERATIERLLAQKFHLAPQEVARLIEAAERSVERSAQLFPFTREICRRMSPEGQVRFVEMLWKVAYADGELDPHEDMLVRRVAGLINVSDRERQLARRRALEKLAARGDAPG